MMSKMNEQTKQMNWRRRKKLGVCNKVRERERQERLYPMMISLNWLMMLIYLFIFLSYKKKWCDDIM